MTRFPWAETGLRLLLDLDGDGSFSEDVTDYLVGDVQIKRGRQSDGASADTSTLTCSLKNGDKRFSRRWPAGPYFGRLTNNTALRAVIPHRTTRLRVPRGVERALSAPDTAALSITGDIDVRLDLGLDSAYAFPSSATGGSALLNKWLTAGGQRSWELAIGPDGRLVWYWSASGSAYLFAICTQRLPRGPKRQTVRVTHDVDNGASGNTVTFWTGPGLAGPWTQLGDAVVTAGTTSIYDSSATVSIGDAAGDGGRLEFEAFGVEIRQGIAGTVRSALDLTNISAAGLTSKTDAQGNVWTLAAGAELAWWDARFTGRVPIWPGDRGAVSDDATVQITAYDVLRDGARSKALDSAYRRGYTTGTVSGLVGYWPMEDAAGSTTLASGLPGGSPASLAGTPTLAAESPFIASGALPKMGSARVTCPVAQRPSATAGTARVLASLPAAGTTDGAILMSYHCQGTAVRWDVVYSSLNALTLNVYSPTGSVLLTTGAIGTPLHGNPGRISLTVTQNGSGVDYALTFLQPGSSVYSAVAGGTLASNTVTSPVSVVLNASRHDLGDTVMGHPSIQTVAAGGYDDDDALNAYGGETAGERIVRLAGERGWGYRVHAMVGPLLGPQLPVKLVDLLRMAETSDAGLLFSPRDRIGIGYRSLRSLLARDAVITAARASAGLVDLKPTESDQNIANDVTATRDGAGGSSARVQLASGPLSVQDPPDGVGVYDGSPLTVSVTGDSALADHAGWGLHMGTVDEPIVPSIGWDLGAIMGTDAASLALLASLQDLDIGDRVVITGVPDDPSDVDQIIVGLSERIAPWVHEIGAVCRAARPYQALRWGVGDRWASAGTVTVGSHAAGATSVAVSTPGGRGWRHNSGDYDVVIAGNRMTVTGVTGTGASQTLLVTRGVNGVDTLLPAGSAVRLAERRYWVM